MGKSLSIILLIIKTLGDAHDWQVNQDAAALSGITATKRSTRATLVIVPSACEPPSFTFDDILTEITTDS